MVFGWRKIKEVNYLGDDGEILTFELFTRFSRKYKMRVTVKKGDKVIDEDEQNLNLLVGKGFEMLDDLKWLKFMSEYYKRWKNEVVKERTKA